MVATPEERKNILSDSITCPRCDGSGLWDFGKCGLCYGDKRVTGECILYLFKDFCGLQAKVKEFVRSCGLG